MRETTESRLLTTDEFETLVCSLSADQIDRINDMLGGIAN